MARPGTGVHLRAMIGIAIISFSAICVRGAATTPSTAALYRTLYALPLLGLIRWLHREPDGRSSTSRRLAWLSGLLLAVDFAAWHRAIGDLGAGLATVLGNTQVLFVGVAAWLIHRERPTRSAFLLLPAILVGVAFVSGLGRADAYGSAPLAGTAWGIATGIAYASFLLVHRAANRELVPAIFPLFDTVLAATAGSVVVGLLDGGLRFPHDLPTQGWLLALALGPQAIGWLLISAALPRLPALETSVLLLAQPILTMTWGYLFFAESLSALQLAGVVAVLGGVGILSRFGSVESIEQAEPIEPV